MPIKKALRPTRIAVILGSVFFCLGVAALGQTGGTTGADRVIDYRAFLLDLAAAAEPTADLGPARAQLDVFELELRPRLAAKKSAAAKVAAIVDYFYREQLWNSSGDLADPSLFYVHRVLAGKTGYCLSLSAIILAVGQRLELPLFGVACPRHFFVRWDDGKNRFNIETTESGKIRPDDFYRSRGVSPAAESAGVYLRNLTSVETCAYLVNNEGFVLWSAQRKSEAAKRFASALKHHPNLPEAWINRGIICAEEGRADEAKECFDRVLAWLPADSGVLFNRALSALKSKKWSEALEDLRRGFLDATPSQWAHYRHILGSTLLLPETWREYQMDLLSRVADGLAGRRPSPGLRATFFADPKFEKEIGRRVDRTIDFEWRRTSPFARVPGGRFSARWDGFIEADEASTHQILVAVDGRARVFIDDVCLLEVSSVGDDALGVDSVRLEKGRHRLKIEFTIDGGSAALTFKMKKAAGIEALGPGAFSHE